MGLQAETQRTGKHALDAGKSPIVRHDANVIGGRRSRDVFSRDYLNFNLNNKE